MTKDELIAYQRRQIDILTVAVQRLAAQATGLDPEQYQLSEETSKFINPKSHE